MGYKWFAFKEIKFLQLLKTRVYFVLTETNISVLIIINLSINPTVVYDNFLVYMT